jgi:hypothetical protein
MQEERDFLAASVFFFCCAVLFIAACKCSQKFRPIEKKKSWENRMVEDYIQLRRMIMQSDPCHGATYEGLIRQFKEQYIKTVDYATRCTYVGELFSVVRNSQPVLINQPVCN